MHIYILNRNCINLKSLRAYIVSFFIILFQELKTNIIDIYYHSFTHSQLTLVFNRFCVWSPRSFLSPSLHGEAFFVC